MVDWYVSWHINLEILWNYYDILLCPYSIKLPLIKNYSMVAKSKYVNKIIFFFFFWESNMLTKSKYEKFVQDVKSLNIKQYKL